jgi:hypothetical protein
MRTREIDHAAETRAQGAYRMSPNFCLISFAASIEWVLYYAFSVWGSDRVPAHRVRNGVLLESECTSRRSSWSFWVPSTEE